MDGVFPFKYIIIRRLAYPHDDNRKRAWNCSDLVGRSTEIANFNTRNAFELITLRSICAVRKTNTKAKHVFDDCNIQIGVPPTYIAATMFADR